MKWLRMTALWSLRVLMGLYLMVRGGVLTLSHITFLCVFVTIGEVFLFLFLFRVEREEGDDDGRFDVIDYE